MKLVSAIRSFLTTDIWRIRVRTLPKTRSFFINHLRVLLLALRGFNEDNCSLHASALTFFTLLSVVPIMAMAFGIAKGFGMEKLLQEQLMTKFQGQEAAMEKIVSFAQTLLENTKGGVIAGIGAVLLIWTVIKVLGNVELSFNEIWGIKKSRSLVRKFSDYIAIMLICPFLLILSSSLTVYITSQITTITEKISLLGAFSPLIFAGLKMLPYMVLWVVFSFIYIAMPNTRVNVGAGMCAGIIAGTIYQIVQWMYITFQIGVSNYGAIYGSFAALPLFLVWLQTSWLIVLLGAELSFAYQNVDTYEFEPDCLTVKPSFKRLLALHVVQLLIKRQVEREGPITATTISHVLEIPIRLLNQILFELVKAQLVVEIKSDETRALAYHFACDPHTATIHATIAALDETGTAAVPVKRSPALEHLESAVAKLDRLVATAPANTLLKDL